MSLVCRLALPRGGEHEEQDASRLRDKHNMSAA